MSQQPLPWEHQLPKFGWRARRLDFCADNTVWDGRHRETELTSHSKSPSVRKWPQFPKLYSRHLNSGASFPYRTCVQLTFSSTCEKKWKKHLKYSSTYVRSPQSLLLPAVPHRSPLVLWKLPSSFPALERILANEECRGCSTAVLPSSWLHSLLITPR